MNNVTFTVFVILWAAECVVALENVSANWFKYVPGIQ